MKESQKIQEKFEDMRILDELKNSYLNYAMSVIVSRALPDVRDGLKPSQRRILVAMNDLNLGPRSKHRKCAKIVGDTGGNYHPHGDQATYGTLVRLAQEWNMRYPLIDPQGNFGSIDSDPPAAMRYTEARMAAPATEMLDDIRYETVDFVPNYDETRMEPTVLPSKFPNLLVNGSTGIAVGMATNIAPHNVREVCDALLLVIDEPNCGFKDIIKRLPGPDFPTGGIIYGRQGIADMYATGRGRIQVRARAQVEERESTGRSQIVVTEIPYLVNKARLVEQIAELTRDKKLEGISDLRDESDRDGMRVVIELKRDATPLVVLNNLYQHTQMQTTFGAIMLALVDGRPKELSLREMLAHFIEHRHSVITRRTQFDLEQAEAREHILEGLKIAVDNIDAVIKIIRGSKTAEEADQKLRTRFKLSEKQSKAILDMRLAKLTGLEIEKLEEELKEVRALIKELKSILASKPKRMAILKKEIEELADEFGDGRRTEIVADEGDFSVEDLIAEEDMVVTVSHAGYIKRIAVSTYRRQRRGGRGLNGMHTKEEDWVEHLFIASTHDYVMFFTQNGQVYWLKVYDIPQMGRAAKGKPIVNCIAIKPEERIAALVNVREFGDDKYLMFATRNGTVKKTVLSAYGNVRATGLNAINIEDGDELIDVQITDGTNDVVLATRHGMSIRFHEKDARDMGRATTGVKGIELEPGDAVIGMVVVRREATLLAVAEHGLGKRSELADYRVQYRGGKGIITLRCTDKTGDVVALKEVIPGDELMVISRHGVIIRLPVDDIRVIGRNTQGVKIINLDEGDAVQDVARVVREDEGGEEG
ncbi:MAG TPA: DNA gyrase subunit A, partial [Actinomycetota bacterium]